MPLDHLLEQLYARRRFGIRPGLDRVTALLERLGNPHLSFQSIHEVGTNGKGSTSASSLPPDLSRYRKPCYLAALSIQ
jgi:dihydrofolate synthase/folylpolyglutamate synthase